MVARPQKDDDDKMLTKRQQMVLAKLVQCDKMVKDKAGLWRPWLVELIASPPASASTIYALAHQGLVAFVDAATVSPTPKGEALAALLDETTMVTRRGVGVVIS